MGAGGFFAEPGKRFLKLEAGSAVFHRKYRPDIHWIRTSKDSTLDLNMTVYRQIPKVP